MPETNASHASFEFNASANQSPAADTGAPEARTATARKTASKSARKAPAKSAAKSTAKPSPKSSAKSAASARTKPAAKPPAKSTAKPAAKSAAKPAKKSAAKPAAKSSAKAPSKPSAKSPAKTRAASKSKPKTAATTKRPTQSTAAPSDPARIDLAPIDALTAPAPAPVTPAPMHAPAQTPAPVAPAATSAPVVHAQPPSRPAPTPQRAPAPQHAPNTQPTRPPQPARTNQPARPPQPAPTTHADSRPTPPPAPRHAPSPQPRPEPAAPTTDDDRDNQPPEQHEPLNPETFATDKTFDDLGLHPAISRGVKDLGFRHPTHIQATLIPVFLTGKDILGQAKTGTGKTAAFALPLLHMVERGVWGQALILAPTRELAIQIHAEFVKLGKHMPVRAVPIYGGQPIKTQAQKLEKGCEIIVGTPGRLMDMIERRLIDPRAVRFAVLDEVDRMLDIGFREDIRRILKMTSSDRQTVMVSATIRGDIEDLARRYMRDPEKLVTTAGALTVDLVAQHYLSVEPWDKRRLLHHLLTHEEPALTLIFCRLKKTVDDLAYYLNKHGIEAHAMHGDMSQSKRNSTMRQLRAGDLAVLIASDLASRGIDVEGITHVINYDLPEDPDLYVHRIGRTARAGRDGIAWAFVTPRQGKLLSQIEDLINAQIPKMDYPDFQASPRPEGFRDEPTGGRPVYEVQGVGDKPRNRYAEVERPDLPKPAATAVDTTKFPGGIVPTKMPLNRMRGKIKSGR